MKTDYAPFLKGGEAGPFDARRLTRAFYSLLVSRCYHLVELAPGRTHRLLEAYLERFVVEDIKRLLRAKHSKRREVPPLIAIPKGYDYVNLPAMAEAPTLQEAMKLLERTRFSEAADSMPVYQKHGLISVVEASLDKVYYDSEVLPSVEGVPARSGVMEMIGVEIDIMNIRTMADLRARGVEPDFVQSVSFTPVELKTSEVAAISHSNVDQVAEILARTRYSNLVPLFKDSLDPSKEESLDHAVGLEIHRASKRLMIKLADTPAYILGYVREAETEANNLVSIATGKDLGLAEPKIATTLCI